MGFAKVTDQEMHVKLKARPLRLHPACGTGCSFGIHLAVDQVLWYICGACHRFMLYGLFCEGKKYSEKPLMWIIILMPHRFHLFILLC